MNIFLPLGFIVGVIAGIFSAKVYIYYLDKYNRYKADKAKNEAIQQELDMKAKAAKEIQDLVKSLGGDKWIANVEAEHMYSLQPMINWRGEWNNYYPCFQMRTTLSNKQ